MNAVFQISVISSPLLLASFGALCSEYAGRMAIFAEGIINLGAFLCFAFSVLFMRIFSVTEIGFPVIFFAVLLSLICCCLFIVGFSVLIERLGVNPFLVSLALNLVCSGLISFFSAVFFKTRGVLISEAFSLDGARSNLITMIFSFVVSLLVAFFIMHTKRGLYLRITGSDEKVLLASGVSPVTLRIFSWGMAGILCALAGCVMTLRLSSFVPGVASGTGWLALAAVFLGRKKVSLVFVSVIIFSAARFFAANIQNFSSFSQIPSGVLLALPYMLALIFIFVSDGKRS